MSSVLAKYHGKTILFLANRFSFFGQGEKNVFDVCDPKAIAAAVAKDTNLLFLFRPSQSISLTQANISQSYRFHNLPDLSTAIAQPKQFYNLTHARYAITLPRKWHQVLSPRPEGLAKSVVKQLRRKLPTERFLVTFHEWSTSTPPPSGMSPPEIIVTIGIPHHNSMAALERREASEQMADTSASDGLLPVEAYMIVEAIPLHHRVDLLWNAAESASNGNVVTLRSQFTTEALTASLIQTTHREIQLVLDKAPWPDKLLPSNPLKHSFEELRALFASHLPALHVILFHPQALEPAVVVNNNVQSVLSYALAATRPQSKRQIAAQALMPTHYRRRRTRAFLRAGITRFLRNKGFTEIKLSNFFSRASQLHTLSNPIGRNTSAAILRVVAGLTKQSEHAVMKAKQDATSVVHSQSYLDPRDWDARTARMKERSKMVMKEGNEARKMLTRMLIS
ncbi:hypothetical protein F5Y09DRAFT_320231 [Xylaria sp. FL1042]|nr:hypothetical protein F5Y09DRAFT_320231 [Xylaria sp. FL1042]